MADPVQERGGGKPIPVTFILTGYNQADLIDAAITGALEQDYPNLQIILTDDASTDATYERMRTRAQAYAGPHRVVLNRLAENRGTLGNIYSAAAKATGDLIVLAGGDDVSYPERTSALVAHWLRTGADALYSKYDLIDEDGRMIEQGWTPDSSRLFLRDYFPGQQLEPLHGASAACHRSVFERFPLPAERIRSEDTFLTLMLALQGGRIEFVDRALVAYRRHAGAITNEAALDARAGAIAAREKSQMAFAASQHELLKLFARERALRGVEPALPGELRDDLRLYELRGRWASAGFWQRLRVLPAARRRGHLGWLLPRLAGLTAFGYSKRALLAWRRRADRTHRKLALQAR